MKILIDMNLSPDWVAAFAANGIETIHWSSVGEHNAKDEEILDYARTNGYVVFTHDLDFGTILALTQTKSPSVIQVRTQDVLPANLANVLIPVLRKYEAELNDGSLIVIDETKARVRILPLRRSDQ